MKTGKLAIRHQQNRISNIDCQNLPISCQSLYAGGSHCEWHTPKKRTCMDLSRSPKELTYPSDLNACACQGAQG
jgi:hypothetical protein